MAFSIFNFEFSEDDELAFLLAYETRAQRSKGGSRLVGVPRIIFEDTTDHAFVAPGPTTLITAPVAAGSLRLTGDFLEYVAEYTLQGVGNSKTITYSFGGVNLNAAPWNNTLSSTQIVLIGRVYRLTATTCRCYIAASLPFLGQSNPFTQFGDITVANMDSNALNFVVSVAAVANDDVIHKVSHMYITQN